MQDISKTSAKHDGSDGETRLAKRDGVLSETAMCPLPDEKEGLSAISYREGSEFHVMSLVRCQAYV